MIVFRPLTAADFPAWRDYFIADYAREIVENYRLTPGEAQRQAARDVELSFPDGPGTAGQQLVHILAANGGSSQPIGYLWYKPDPIMRSVFICDFFLFAHCRGQGFGKAALHQLETQLAAEGYTQMMLRVAAHNTAARRVYDACGFNVTGINMNKVLNRTGEEQRKD
ncbi:GNAT family N-acetyltransferase [Siccibacter colletis]|uniref:GNAT family N-acetyltransferase n=1 Tax=Siccibacter colletis TaxID=1505757 RepID=UPI003CF142F9